jgi:hypothetical protein
MTRRAPLLLSAIALAVSLLGPAAIGHAAGSAARPVERAFFAYRAGHSRYAKDAVHATRADRAGLARRAATAGSAANAVAVDGIQASRTPTPNMLLPLDASGKLPASIGAVGPVGPRGAAGPAGSAGISGLQLVTADSGSNSNTVKSQSVSCPSGKKVVGGGASVNTTSSTLAITRSSPASDLSGWTAEAQETAAFVGNWRVSVYAVCATVTA